MSSQPEIESPYPASQEAPLPAIVEEKRASSRASIVFAIATFLLLLLAYKLLKELQIIYVAALFAVVLMPIVTRITNLQIGKYRPSRVVAIIALMVTVLAALTIFFLIGLPPVLDDLRGFLTDLPSRIPGLADRIHHLPGANKLDLSTVTAKAENLVGAIGAYVVTAIPRYLSHLFDALTCTFLCIYFMLEGEAVYGFFLSLFPSDSRRRLDITLKKAEVKMSGWLLGQATLMLILGVLSLIVFGILHVRYFILLGVCMGLFNIIPIAGGVVTIVIVAIVAAFDSWAKMAGVLIFYLIYVNLENAVLTPRIMKSSVDLSGLTVLVALLVGTALAGIVGALVAVPTAALVAVLLDEYAVQKT